MAKKSERVIKRELKRLRSFIDDNIDNPKMAIEIRCAYEVETAIRWATENTVGWAKPLESAMYSANLIRKGK